MLYDGIIEQTAELGEIDGIGVASEAHPTAVCFAGNKLLKKYADGTKKTSLVMQVSGLDTVADQQELVKRLCRIGERLSAVKDMPFAEGITQPRFRVSSLPVPTMQDGTYWIYSMLIELEFYTKGLV